MNDPGKLLPVSVVKAGKGDRTSNKAVYKLIWLKEGQGATQDAEIFICINKVLET